MVARFLFCLFLQTLFLFCPDVQVVLLVFFFSAAQSISLLQVWPFPTFLVNRLKAARDEVLLSKSRLSFKFSISIRSSSISSCWVKMIPTNSAFDNWFNFSRFSAVPDWLWLIPLLNTHKRPFVNPPVRKNLRILILRFHDMTTLVSIVVENS